MSVSRFDQLETPCAIINLKSLSRNLEDLLDLVESSETSSVRVTVRPHFKAHKCTSIAIRQLECTAGGGNRTVGITAQKVNEVESLISAGICDILLSNEIVCTKKLCRLAALAVGRIITDIDKYIPNGSNFFIKACEPKYGLKRIISLVVDDESAAIDASNAAVAENVIFNVLIDIDVGQNRCGVVGKEAAVELAKKVSLLPGLSLKGIQAYHGSSQHIRSETERKKIVERVATAAADVRDAIRNAGLCCDVVTGGGTGTVLHDAASGVFTEIQPGSYALGDVDYAKNSGGISIEPAVFLATTVMSVREGEWIVVDSGLKAQSVDSGPPAFLCTVDEFCKERGVIPIGRAEAAAAGLESLIVSSVSDEHTTLKCQNRDEKILLLPRKTILLFQPGHVDPFMNHYTKCYVVDGESIIDAWTINRNPGL